MRGRTKRSLGGQRRRRCHRSLYTSTRRLQDQGWPQWPPYARACTMRSRLEHAWMEGSVPMQSLPDQPGRHRACMFCGAPSRLHGDCRCQNADHTELERIGARLPKQGLPKYAASVDGAAQQRQGLLCYASFATKKSELVGAIRESAADASSASSVLCSQVAVNECMLACHCGVDRHFSNVKLGIGRSLSENERWCRVR